MWQEKFLLLLYILAIALPKTIGNTRLTIGRKEEDTSDLDFFGKKGNRMILPTTTAKPAKGEVVIEKFVETLISSEKYLKMVETVERKLNHLDTAFHERSNAIIKYLSEVLRMVKPSSVSPIENALKTVKTDLDKLKQSVLQKIEDNPNMRVDGQDFRMDSSLDSRLSYMDGNIKSVLAGVESIMTVINEVKNRQYTKNYSKSDKGHDFEALNLISEFRRTLHDKMRKCDCKNERVDRSERYPTDCHEIQMQGFNVSGIYKIKPDEMDPFYVLCDLTTAGGGWTVFQNRYDGSQDFYKSWTDYKHGFGNLAGEFWLGLEKIHYLTNQKLYELRIEMETQHGQEAYAAFSVFTIGPEYEGYRISTLGTFYGTAGDSLSYHAGQKFSTLDVDNDEWKDGACSTEHGGAWWYKECDKSNLNGKYSASAEEHRGQSIYWISFKGPNFPLTKTKMMIRPLPASRPSNYGDQTRKVLDTPKLRIPDKQKPIRTKDVKSNYDLSQSRSPYTYDELSKADHFFPNFT